MSAQRTVWAMTVEGWGQDTTVSAGVAFFFGLHAPVGGREWIPALSSIPSGTSARIDPFTGGGLTTSSMTFTLDASDRVAEALLYEAAAPTHTVLETNPLEIGETSLVLEPVASGVYPDSGEVIWVGDEALFVVTGGAPALTVQRAYWGTVEQTHGGGAGVFSAMPHWPGRLVTLLEVALNVDGTVASETTRWRGVISDDASQIGPNIVVKTADLIGAFRSASLNEDAPALAHNIVRSYDGTYFGGAVDIVPRVSTGDAGAVLPSVYLQADDALFATLYTGGGVTSLQTRLLATQAELDEEQSAEPEDPTVPERVFEVAVWLRDAGSLTTGEAPSLAPTNPFHPLAIVLELLTSTGRGTNGAYDVLGASFGLGIDFVDWSAWESEIAATPELVVDRVILGWDGETFEPFVEAERIMRPFGYFFGLDETGLIQPARLRMATEADLDGVTGATLYVDGPRALERADAPVEVRAIVGELPWRSGRPVTVRSPERAQRAARLVDRITHEIDLGVLDPDKVAPDGILDPAETALVAMLKIGLDSVPRLRGRLAVPDRIGATYSVDLGAILPIASLGGLRDPWLIDGAGRRIAIDGSASWAGLVVERGLKAANSTYEVAVLLLNWRAGRAVKERAPAAVIGAGSTSTVLELDTSGPYGASPGLAFDAGDEITVCAPDGVRDLTTNVVVTTVSASAIGISPALSSVPGQNAVVRLAQSFLFDSTRYAGTSRPVAYIAADAATPIEDGSATLEGPDVYGTSIFGGAGGQAPASPRFQAIDSDALTSPNEVLGEPWDAWAVYTMRQNESELLQRAHQISWAPLANLSGDHSTSAPFRPYASSQRSTILYVPWLVQPNTAELRASINARVSTEATDALEVAGAEYRFELELAGVSESFTEFNTAGAAPPFGTREIVLDLTPVDLTRNVFPLILWGESRVDAFEESAGVIDAPRSDFDRVVAASGSTYTDTASPSPNADSLDTMVTELAGGALFEHLQSKSATEMACAFGEPVLQLDLAPTDGNTRFLPYAQVKGIELHQTFVDFDFAADEPLRPRTPVRAELDALHLSRGQRIYKRARPIWVGPQGERPGATPGNIWPDGYTQRHTLVAAKDTATDSLTLTASVWVDTPGATLALLAYVLPLHYLGEALKRPDPLARASLVQWDSWLTIEQLEAGDINWTDATTRADGSANPVTQQLRHVPAVADGRYPALYQHHLRRENSRWTYREGQLYEGDLRYVQPIAVDLGIGAGFDLDRPARVALNLNFVDVEWNETANRTTDGLDLVVVGASIWEIPAA